MARTVDPATHAIRRDAFVEATQRLIALKGYEEMSVQDVLDELDASRGAFYHYFDSKVALLEAVIGRMKGEPCRSSSRPRS
jgi:AcrR family transcriptional regulator